VSPRRPAFADLPPLAVDALLAADLVIDLTTVPWLYSDSFTRYGQECQARGSRLALVWGMPGSLRTVAARPLSVTLANRARRALPRLNDARTLRVRSTKGTDFHVPMIGADEPGALGNQKGFCGHRSPHARRARLTTRSIERLQSVSGSCSYHRRRDYNGAPIGVSIFSSLRVKVVTVGGTRSRGSRA
jgi:hypothetical protein